MALKTRRPTGATSWPLILLAGEAKTGKTWSAAAFSGDKRIARTFWLDLGEGCADEYGAVPNADYEIIEHDGTWVDIVGQVEEVREVARDTLTKTGKPVLLVIDSMTTEWAMLSEWTDKRARRSHGNRKLLADDPDAEIDITANYWNDTNSRHNRLMNILKTFPGIVVMTALETEKTQFDANGRPKKGAPKVARPDAQKRIGADSTVWIRLSLDDSPTIVGIRSVRHTIRPGKDKPEPMDDFDLGKLVFDYMAIGKDTQVRNMPTLDADQSDDPVVRAKNRVWVEAQKLGWDGPTLIADYAKHHNGAAIGDAAESKLDDYAAELRQAVEKKAAGGPATEGPAATGSQLAPAA